MSAPAAEVQEGVAGQLRLAGPLTAVTAPSFRPCVCEAVRDGQVHRVLEAQRGSTLVLRANAVVCRALKDRATITAFALWTGPGI